MGLDSGNAQSAFIELAFGVNTLFAVYAHFRESVTDRIDKGIKVTVAQVQALEATGKRVSGVVSTLETWGRKHLDFQWHLTRIMVIISTTMAAVCLLTLYCDLLAWVGYWNIVLVSPLPSFWLISNSNAWLFNYRAIWKLKRFDSLIKEFEGTPPIPPPPAEFPDKVSKDDRGGSGDVY